MLIFERGADVLDFAAPEDIFLVKPYVPMCSTVLLFGMPTLGKTPIGWALAEAVQTGGQFLGITAQQGNALVLEFDMPIYLVKDRWLNADPRFAPHFSVMFEPQGVDTTQLVSGYPDKRHREVLEAFLGYHAEYRPRLVVIDALREVIRGDMSSMGIADHVYRAWHSIFPDAAIVFIHHESKDKDPLVKSDPMQKAKGSLEFVDVAQVGMRLEKTQKGTYLSVVKTQASAIPSPRAISVGKDGVHING